MIRSVFISRDLDQVPLLTDFCRKHHINLEARSLIRFEGITAHPSHAYDIVFFPSIRAAEFFLACNPLPSDVQVACIGRQTAEKLSALGLNPTFVGEKSGDPAAVAEAFVRFVGNKRVLIPSSTESNRSMQQKLPESQTETLTVYKTLSEPTVISPADLYVFSSPTNLTAFLESNSIPAHAKTVAWGTTTRRALEASGIECHYVLETAEETELITWIKQNG